MKQKQLLLISAIILCLPSYGKPLKPSSTIHKPNVFVRVVPLSSQDLIKSAGIIFKGRLISSKETTLNDLSVRKYKFEIEDAIQGIPPKQKIIVLNEWAGFKSPMIDEVKIGELYVFFFNKPSSYGLTSLTGIEQGLVSFSDEKPVLKTQDEYKQFLPKGLAKKAALLKSNPRPDLNNYSDLKKYIIETLEEAKHE